MRLTTGFGLLALLALFFLASSVNAQCGITVSCSPDQTITTPGLPGSPQFSNLAATPTNVTASISWNTDIDSNSILNYGLTASYGSQRTDPSFFKTGHTITIASLTPSTTYHYAITACTPSPGSLCNITPDNVFSTNATSVPPTPPPIPPGPPTPPTPPPGGGFPPGPGGGGGIPPLSCSGCAILSRGSCVAGTCAPTICPESYCSGTDLVEYSADQVLNSCQVIGTIGTCSSRACIPSTNYSSQCDTLPNRLGGLFGPSSGPGSGSLTQGLSVELLRYIAIAIAVVGILLAIMYYLLEYVKEQKKKNTPEPVADTIPMSPYNR